ncbi:hypothetical protein MRY82_05100 [bacterium]|nr:hypothetical protein [bacterium]
MARLSRVVVPNIAHHLVNRGNRRQMVFFKDEDYQVFLELLALFSSAYQVQIAAYCLAHTHKEALLKPR